MNEVLLFICLMVFAIGELLMICTSERLKSRSANFAGSLGVAFMISSAFSTFLWLYCNSLISEVASTKTTQTEAVEKLNINGYPISYTDLPDGTYIRLEESECFAFVQRECENPFEENIIAVYSDEKIPWHFAIAKIPEEVKEEIKKIEEKNFIKGPLARTMP